MRTLPFQRFVRTLVHAPWKQAGQRAAPCLCLPCLVARAPPRRPLRAPRPSDASNNAAPAHAAEDKARGKIYFYNSFSMERRWKLPSSVELLHEYTARHGIRLT